MFWYFDEVSSKKLQKVPHFVKKHEKSSIWRKLATFPTNYHVLTLWWTFQRKVAESASFSEKTLKIIDWAKTCNFFEQSNMFMRFDELFSKRKQKVPRFVKKHKKSSIWPKLSTFRTNYHVLAFRWTFQEKSAKSGPFREKARKLIDLAKTCNFSKKLPCLCISINFSGKSCKKCLISWNSTKNHWFGQSFATFGTSYNVFFLLMNFQEKSCKKCVVSWKSTKNHRFSQIATFRENYHVLTFRWTLQQKVAKSCSCREKARKIINLAKSLQLFEQTSMFLHFDEFSRKKLPKVLRFVKKHENHRFGQNFATFRANYHVLAFRWSFQQKVTKSASFREKARKIVDLAKTRNFSNKLPCFDALVNFSAKSCRKCLVFWENSKNHRLGQDLQLFRTK